MRVDLRAVTLRDALDRGNVEGARRFAVHVLRAGDVDDDLAAAIADAIEAKGRRGPKPKADRLELAMAVNEALDDAPKLEAALEAVADAHGVSFSTVRNAWRQYGAIIRA